MSYKSTLLIDTYINGRYILKKFTIVEADSSTKKENYIITDSKIAARELEIDSPEELEELRHILSEVS